MIVSLYCLSYKYNQQSLFFYYAVFENFNKTHNFLLIIEILAFVNNKQYLINHQDKLFLTINHLIAIHCFVKNIRSVALTDHKAH